MDEDKSNVFVVAIVAMIALAGVCAILIDKLDYADNMLSGFVVDSTSYTQYNSSSLTNMAVDYTGNNIYSNDVESSYSCKWTDWKDRDEPSVTGDWETLSEFSDVCSNPVAVECRTTENVDYRIVGQKVTCNTKSGFVCQNSDNPAGCLDYMVRFCCSNAVSNSSTGSSPNVTFDTRSTSTNDFTPRIAVWQGKVNQHVDINTGTWYTDSDGISGAELDKLTYCKKFYPSTKSVTSYTTELITGWRNRYNTGGPFSLSVLSYKCVDSVNVVNYTNFTNQDSVNISVSNSSATVLKSDLIISKVILREKYSGAILSTHFNSTIVYLIKPVVKNIGTKEVSVSSFYIGSYYTGESLSSIGKCSASGIILYPGQEYECDSPNIGGYGSNIGNYTYSVMVDYGYNIAELDETNNRLYYSFVVFGSNLAPTINTTVYNNTSVLTNASNNSLNPNSSININVSNYINYSNNNNNNNNNNNTINTSSPIVEQPMPIYNQTLINQTTTQIVNQTVSLNQTNSTIIVSDYCYDSESSIDLYSRGYVNSSSGFYQDSCYGDFVLDFYCSNPQALYPLSVNSTCPNGCDDGACLQDSLTKVDNNKLDKYPQIFLRDSTPDVLFVVGRKSSNEDVQSVTSVINSFKKFLGQNISTTGLIKFDDMVTESDIENNNLVLIGGMCANKITEKLYGGKKDCTSKDNHGVAHIKLHVNSKTGKYVLFVHGYDAQDTVLATKVLENWDSYSSLISTSNSICATENSENLNVYSC